MTNKLRHTILAITAILLCQLAFGQSYRTEKDIPYHNQAGEYASERCKLDFYYPLNAEDFPTVVWFHGGGLEGGSKQIPQELTESGIGIIAVNYRLMPKASITDCIDDAAAAVAWAFREVATRGGSPEKIYVAGHSAGGYLTDMIVLDKSYLKKYDIDADKIAGVFPYSAQVITHFNSRKAQGLGPLTVRVDETAPLYHVRKLPMPMLIFSGDRELELFGRYEEQAYFWRMMVLVGNKDIKHYELQGFDHGEMAHPAHLIVRKYLLNRHKLNKK